MKNKKLRALISGVLAVCFMLGAIVPVSAGGFFSDEWFERYEENWGNYISDLINGRKDNKESDSKTGTASNDAATTAATDSDFSRILHLDCGRKYFSPEWIKALIVEMQAAGYNQLQLAFGNGGFRFYLNDMGVTVGNKTYGSGEVKDALDKAFVSYNSGELEYQDNWKKTYTPEKNYLTETEMDEIIAYAGEHDIEIVPLFNTPGHMQVLIGAMAALGLGEQTTNSLCVKDLGCLNLNRTDAVEFTQNILAKYIKYFKNKGSNYFSLGADEYTEWNTEFYTYINQCIKLVTDAGMTPRVFVDSFRKNQSAGITDKSVQVCYWYYDTDSVWTASQIDDAGYGIINTSHDYYYVSTNEAWNLNEWNGNRGEGYTFVYNTENKTYANVADEWIAHAKNFNRKTFSCKGSTQTLSTWNGAMFCIWTNVPYVRDETQIAQDIRSILRIIGQRMNDVDAKQINYSKVIPGGFNEDGTINTTEPEKKPSTVYDKSGNNTASSDNSDNVKVTAGGLTSLTVADTTVNTSSFGELYPATGSTTVKNVLSYDITPGTADGDYTGEATVSLRIPDGWNKTNTRAFIVNKDNTISFITGTVDGEWYTFTAPHFSVMGLYEIETTAVEPTDPTGNEVNVTLKVGDTSREFKHGAGLTIEGKTNSIAVVNEKNVGGGTGTATAVTTPTSGGKYIIGSNGYYMGFDGNDITEKDDPGEAVEWTVTKSGNNYTLETTYGGTKYYLYHRTDGASLDIATTKSTWNYDSSYGFYYTYKNRRITYNVQPYCYTYGDTYWTTSSNYSLSSYYKNTLYTYTPAEPSQTKISFTGVTPGTTTVTVTEADGTKTTYNITVELKKETVELPVGQSKTFDTTATGTTQIGNTHSEFATAAVANKKLTVTGIKPGTTVITTNDTEYTVTVKYREKTLSVNKDGTITAELDGYDGTKAEIADESIVEAKNSGTVLTVNGLAVGTTTITTEATIYTVNVVEFEIDDNDKLYVDFWVTNMPVGPTGVTVTKAPSPTSTGEDVTRAYTGISPRKATDTDGVRILDLIKDANGSISTTGTVYKTGNNTVVWKARYLPESVRQTTAAWANKSGEGTDTETTAAGAFDFEYVRYGVDGWKYKDASGEWKNFPFDPSEDTNGAQIAIYYRQPTKVTEEVTTEVIDWPDNSKTKFYGVAVDFAVKYEADGTRYPNSFGSTADKPSFWYNCKGEKPSDAYRNGYTLYTEDDTDANRKIAYDWYGKSSSKFYRVINNINANETSDYEVYMITVTPSSNTWYTGGEVECPESITYYDTSATYKADANGKESTTGTVTKTREKIIWAEDEETANNSDLSIHSECKYGGNPEVERLIIQQSTGMLVTYYVRLKQAEANLKVHYIDETTGEEFYYYDIKPMHGVTFDPGFAKDDSNTEYGLVNNSVVNDKKNTVKVTSKLEDMPAIPAKYRRVNYTFTKVEKNPDNTEVFLYYTFNNTYSYVVDFGIPLKIEPKDVVANVDTASNIKTFVMSGTAEAAALVTDFGKVTIDGTNVIYSLTDMDFSKSRTKVDSFTVRYYGTNTATKGETDYVDYLIRIYPANSIYYEAETGYGEKDTTGFITFEGNWEKVNDDTTQEGKVYQALEALGNALYPFGYDPAYKTYTKYSLGAAMKSTVYKNTTDAPTASFTFTGTGFDVISLTSKTTGAVIVEVTDKNDAKVKSYIVNTYYGYQCDGEGNWTPVKSGDEDTNPLQNALYQIPVIKVSGLDYGKYNVRIYTKYSGFFDILGLGWYSFYLDAIRIYDPAGDQFKGMVIKNNEEVLSDELFDIAEYTEIRDIALNTDESGASYVVFVDGKNGVEVNSDEFLKYSPNNEVYLKSSQKIAFKVKVSEENYKKLTSVQLAAKLANGDSVSMTSNVPFKTKRADSKVEGLSNDKKAVTITTATDMYYEFDRDELKFTPDTTDGYYYSDPIVITNNNSDNETILSLTNLKVTYNKVPATETQTTASGKEINASYFLIADDETVEAALNYTYVPEPEEPELPEEPEVLPFEPEYLSASWRTVGRYLRTCTLSVVTSRDVQKLTLNGDELSSYTTRRRIDGKYQSVKVWTYVKMNAQIGDYELVAYDENGIASESVTATLSK